AVELTLHPGKRGIPGHIDLARKVRPHLSVIIRIENVIDFDAALLEIGLETFPDGHNFRIVSDGADEQGQAAGLGSVHAWHMLVLVKRVAGPGRPCQESPSEHRWWAPSPRRPEHRERCAPVRPVKHKRRRHRASWLSRRQPRMLQPPAP